jgi:hypothetical protein
MNPVPKHLIAYVRIPRRDRCGDNPQYRLYVREYLEALEA